MRGFFFRSRVVKTPEQIGAEILDRLARQAESNNSASSALRGEIRDAMSVIPAPERLTAKGIRNHLSRVPLPSIRTIQEHMRAIRESSASR